jgi:hypothetical protein
VEAGGGVEKEKLKVDAPPAVVPLPGVDCPKVAENRGLLPPTLPSPPKPEEEGVEEDSPPKPPNPVVALA